MSLSVVYKCLSGMERKTKQVKMKQTKQVKMKQTKQVKIKQTKQVKIKQTPKQGIEQYDPQSCISALYHSQNSPTFYIQYPHHRLY